MTPKVNKDNKQTAGLKVANFAVVEAFGTRYNRAPVRAFPNIEIIENSLSVRKI